MKMTYCIGALAALVVGAGAARADVDISVAIQGEIAPGVYGRVDIGNRPAPALVYANPILIEPPPPNVVVEAPIYLHVPPEHARDWRLHCHEYHACNRQVFFVRSAEYEPGYVRARGRERAEMRHEEHERREERREEHWNREDHDHGHDH